VAQLHPVLISDHIWNFWRPDDNCRSWQAISGLISNLGFDKVLSIVQLRDAAVRMVKGVTGFSLGRRRNGIANISLAITLNKDFWLSSD
jgi:hypothetical protein